MSPDETLKIGPEKINIIFNPFFQKTLVFAIIILSVHRVAQVQVSSINDVTHLGLGGFVVWYSYSVLGEMGLAFVLNKRGLKTGRGGRAV